MALSPALTGSDDRKQWLKTPHCWLNLSAILILELEYGNLDDEMSHLDYLIHEIESLQA